MRHQYIINLHLPLPFTIIASVVLSVLLVLLGLYAIRTARLRGPRWIRFHWRVHFGWRIVAMGQHRTKKTMVAPQYPATGHLDEIVTEPANTHDGADHVLSLCRRVLKSNLSVQGQR